ncbi:MAG: hypothetical protein HY288_01150 [Planctomycetia bacterium]|nr:hypothetical protein [Planctomycetia bacterium]
MAARTSKFEVGEVVVTPAASAALHASGQTIDDFLARHQSGDWGEVSEQLRAVNERGLVERFNIQSVYSTATGERLIVMTTGDRSLTMVHLGLRTD